MLAGAGAPDGIQLPTDNPGHVLCVMARSSVTARAQELPWTAAGLGCRRPAEEWSSSRCRRPAEECRRTGPALPLLVPWEAAGDHSLDT